MVGMYGSMLDGNLKNFSVSGHCSILNLQDVVPIRKTHLRARISQRVLEKEEVAKIVKATVAGPANAQ